MKNLHIMSNEKFIKSYIEFIEEHFEFDKHFFLILGGISEKKFEIPIKKNIIVITKERYNNKIILSFLYVLFFLKNSYKAENIYLHSLFNKKLVIILFLQPWLLKKCNWIIWGGDLYSYQKPKVTIKQKAYEYMRAFCIKRFGGIITHIKGDYKLAQKWYGANGRYYYSFMYPSNLYKNFLIEDKKNNDKVYIQIGNSSDSSNNHIEILKKLEIYKNKNLEIICPLSYGDVKYAKEVMNYGTKNFGDKFISITEFMPFEKYLELLGKIDIAIFNHRRQQAMGNITTLLGFGKKVYIREDITTWQFCLEHDLKVYSSNGHFDDLFKDMDKDIKENNVKNVKSKFSEEKLVEDLKKIFNF